MTRALVPEWSFLAPASLCECFISHTRVVNVVYILPSYGTRPAHAMYSST